MDGIRVDAKKIEAMKDYPFPKTLNILYGFLGSMGYYHKFVQNYGKIAAPLTVLLKQHAFTWNPIKNQSFHALKDVMCTTLILALPNFTDTFFL
jgi:hypothetical protein